MAKEKVVLAYSGGTGLDTNVILRWLTKEKGYDVVTFTANLGQEGFNEKLARERALGGGAVEAIVQDLRDEFVRDYVFPAIRANAKYEGRYLLGTSLARPLTAKAQVDVAKSVGANILAHGSTGKGNDQVRFELGYLTLMPEAQILAPWKEPEFLARFKGRDDLIRYAEANGIPINQSNKKPYSNDDNILHISYEAGMLENPEAILSEDAFRMTVSPRRAPDDSAILEIKFQNGNPVRATGLRIDGFSEDPKKLGVPIFREFGEQHDDPVTLLAYLNRIAGANGIGREDMVENRFVGIKSRGVYETPGGTVLYFAHKDLEGITLDREVMHATMHTSIDLAKAIYEGRWFSPERELMQAQIDAAQKRVNGIVRLELYKGNIIPMGRSSPNSLYDEGLGSMHDLGGFDQTKSRGFIDTIARRLQTDARVAAKMNEK
jgi:argininosuccinate synthase